MTSDDNYLNRLSESLGKQWPEIEAARVRATSERTAIAELFTGDKTRPTSSDADIVVFGSLARKEWTSRSDVDWTLLIDGQAVPEHRQVAHGVAKKLESKYLSPGTTGTFGNLAFSHDIIHLIGGQTDTNINTTQRVLLLLESVAIQIPPSTETLGARERVIRNVLCRYLVDDTNLVSPDGAKSMVPRFLLNDIVRFWRTMCVDFAYKGWEQAQHKWALRNIKLRMSRKLTFASGLLMCASCFLEQDKVTANPGEKPIDTIVSVLLQRIQMTPLDRIAQALLLHGSKKTGLQLLDAYDWFLGMLNDDERRTHLETVPARAAYDDSLFGEARKHSHRFQEALNSLFLNDDEQLTKYTSKYAIF